MSDKKYLTTPIYYVNDAPHIGHTYCTLATDTLARYWRKKLGNENVFFLTGTDENSQKTVDAAKKAGKDVTTYLDEMAKIWRETWTQIGISNNDFIRTTEARHVQTVQNLVHKIQATGDIYKGKYSGKYCTGCETFLKDSELDENGNCPDHKTKPQVIEEENYFFKLSTYQQKLLDWYETHPNFLQPESKRNEVLSFLREGLDDISISREGAQVGISFPEDPQHKVYVWFDALINYYSAIQQDGREDFWNHTVHILGKDITRFHCVIWPAMLMSAGIALPQEMFAHGFFTIDGVKMSKSLGNVVSPLTLSEKYGNDALRVGLLSSFEFGNDGDFSLSNFENLYKTKLAGGVGNLFNRVITLIHKFCEGKKPVGSHEKSTVIQSFHTMLEEYKIKQAIDHFFATVDHANQLLNAKEPWKLAKTDPESANKIFAQLLESLEELATMAELLLPETFPKMKKMLGDSEKVGEAEILFPQIV